jgi:hypothetical protein
VNVLLERPTPLLTEQSVDLRIGQAETLNAPRRRYSLPARFLFLTMDLLYGRRRTLAKFRVLEVVARLPYQAWEQASYKKMNKVHDEPEALASLWARVRGFRAQQDNEQWHLMLLDELAAQAGLRLGRAKYQWLPRVICFGWWHFCWVLYAVKPTWSHRLNADFEDHAEHEYAEFVQENPLLELAPWQPVVCAAYGTFASQADLFRQICLDERAHKQESEAHL